MLLASLIGCASNRQPQAMTPSQMASYCVSNADCRNMDLIIERMKTQLRLKGLQDATPEDLNDDDRIYNANARIVIWSLIIGCNNLDRYKK